MSGGTSFMTNKAFVEEIPHVQNPEQQLATARISQLQFSILKPSDVLKLSHLQIVNRDLYELSKREPQAYGSLDRRLGTSDKKKNCETCKKDITYCVGHFGHINLELPIFHIGFFKEMVRILHTICKSCGCALILPKERENFLRRIRRPDADRRQKSLVAKAITECAKKKRVCPYCKAHQGKVKKLSSRYSLVHEFKHKDALEHREDWMHEFDTAANDNKLLKEHLAKAQEDLTPLDILTLLRKVPDEDCDLLNLDRGETRAATGAAGAGATGLLIGGCRPEDLLYTYVPVPPVCIRPSVAMGTSGTNEDDLTMKIADILQINNTLKLIFQKGDNISGILENWDFLQSQTAMFVNSDLPGFPAHVKSQNMKAIRALSQRLKGKTGRFRGNLSGKRVDFSGRTVISPDPNLSVEQVGVPRRMAKILTFPERITPHNIERMRAAIRNGPNVHPGANLVEYQSGIKMSLKFADRNAVANMVRYGDLVERHLRDDDVVLFNRQPSLHKMSIMAHRAKVLSWRTLRFNECVCTPYNADFDGDEMNLHLPQTEEARAEAGLLMAVRENLVTPRHGEPLVAATQDFLTTGYLITQKDVFYTRSQFCQIVSYFTALNEKLDIPLPTILKPMQLWTGKQVINLLLRPNATDEQWPLINCVVKARNYTRNEHMCPQDGWVIVQNSELVTGNLCKGSLGGAKQGLFYCIIRDHSAQLAAQYMNRLARLSARWIGDQGFSIGVSDVTPSDRLVEKKRNLIRAGYDECDKIISKFNAGKLELEAGCSEEQSLEARMSKELSKLREEAGNDCLVELDRLHNSPLIMEQCGSKGSKINISQMVACVGQQVISGKRIPYGFVNRTLPHFLKHSREPQAKGFVENSFYSGLTATEFFMHTMGGREGLVDTAVKTAETGYMQRRLMKALEDLCVQYDGTVRTAERGIVQFMYGDDGLDPVMMINGSMPADFDRVWLHARASLPAAPEDAMLTTAEILAALAKAVGKLKNDKSARFCDAMEAFVKAKIADIEGVRKALAGSGKPKATIEWVVNATRKITKPQLKRFFKIVRTKYGRAVIEPGTAVGAIAAQSIGEPGTQMTLKTFHFAGVASMNITLGVPRIKEIINAAKKIATPIITAPLQIDTDEKVARIVKGRIEKTILGDIAEYIEEVFTPSQAYVHVKIDLDAIRALQLSINVEHIVTAILMAKQLKLKGGVKHKDNMLRIAPPEQSKELLLYSLQKLKALLPTVIVCGIPSVARAVINNFEDKNDKSVPKKRRYNLLVEGDDLLNVMGTLGVRGKDATSNSIIEVQRVLGIEAARKTIEKEITSTMDAHGLTIDARHVALLADIMSFRGEILGITRFGVSKMKESVLMLASFEKTADHLFEAAVRGATDPVSGVSESIIMGVPIPVGTGLFSLLHQPNANPTTAGLPPSEVKKIVDADASAATPGAPKATAMETTADGAAQPAAGAGAGANPNPVRTSLLRPRRPLLVPQKQQQRR